MRRLLWPTLLAATFAAVVALTGCTSPGPENLKPVTVDVGGRTVVCVVLYSSAGDLYGLSCDWSNR